MRKNVTSPRLKPHATGLTLVGKISLFLLIIIALCAIFAPLLTPYDPLAHSHNEKYEAPSLAHPFGTDRFGRDVLSRILIGSRTSLLIVVVSSCLAAIAGLIIGVSAGFFGGVLDSVLMRIMEALSVIPYLLFAVLFAAADGFSSKGTGISIGICLIPDFATWSRALVLNIQGKGFFEAEKAFGISKAVVLFRHVLPNIFAQYIVKLTSAFSEAVLAVTALGYLGYAVQPPKPEWGDMLAEGYKGIMSGKWWLTLFPGLMILITVISATLLGNNLSNIINSRTSSNGGK
ncbi:MAG: ABC transporter permease [Oscillospiraceae bacterium]|nr:ABC transporter permease [Oscillospiraceae bacterium]